MAATMEPHMQIARRIRSIESAKIELLRRVADLFEGLQIGDERMLSQSLAGLIGTAYVIGQQVGISPSQMDEEVLRQLPRTTTANAADLTELDPVRRHFHAQG
ncbi:MazG-like family protein [Alicyclobacillus herbarius]|uniref:MazG-like family protein n=1 Tax=Alicyclobacillus herbarius TaxID=122960 RepID=UPI0004064911|nr:MazG-like family protein [Alicyclobacillus herbarius]